MTKLQIDIIPDQYEIIHYDTPGIPLYTRKGNLFDYPGRRAPCRRHEDVEFIFLLDEETDYYVNGEHMESGRGEGISINSRVMYYGYAAWNENCNFICLLFHPSLLASCQKVSQRYVEPVLEKRRTPYLCLNRQGQGDIAKRILNIWEMKEQQALCYKVEMISAPYSLWHSVDDMIEQMTENPEWEPFADATALRRIVPLICLHFREELSLQNIANEGDVCKGECRKIFRVQLEQLPINYLDSYRLHISANLLEYTSMAVSDTALEYGSNHLSCYSRLFPRSYGYTPREYRRGKIT